MQTICAVKDVKTGLFENLITVRHENEAKREFIAVCKMPETKFGKYPADYELWRLGQYDDSTGSIIPSTPEHLANGVDNAN